MGSWRDAILREFTPQVARLTLVADPDGLLLEEGILRGIEERGFELIPFEDHVAFRYAYESRYRARWDRGELTDLVVVLRAAMSDLRSLPYDLLQAGRKLTFNLGELFPNLSLRVLDALERSDLDALYEAQARERLDHPLGENQTMGFVLRHVFKVAPETIQDASGLLKFLLERHYKGLQIPRSLDDYLVARFREDDAFCDWPLQTIVSDREAFFGFLQERWPFFLDRLLATSDTVIDAKASRPGEFVGPANLPFDDHGIRVYVDNLFLEGMLTPVAHPQASALASSWAAVGVRIQPAADQRRRWDRLLDSLSNAVPDPTVRHQDWQAFAVKWGQLIVLHKCLGSEPDTSATGRFEALQAQVDAAFFEWVWKRYGTLHNQPPLPPVMIHHVPRLLARTLEGDRDSKVALIVMDGLSLDQWIVAQEVLRAQRPALRLRESTVFAWIPSLTMVSRQACFAGRSPLYFPASIHTTDKEPKAWKRYWEDEGLGPMEVGYEKNIRDASDLERVDQLTSHPKVRAIGLVVDKVDKIMHGMELGTAGMHNQVRQWTEQGALATLLDMLLDRGFAVTLTADHGNIEASGCGRPSEGSLADLRGQRARIFSDALLRARVHERFPDASPWPPLGLPSDYLALVAPHRGAFVRKGDKLVGHGGITVEEIIVPLIRIERK
ncbi:BREX-3 system phosphatase PglZ [Planctomycetota bacterium]